MDYLVIVCLMFGLNMGVYIIFVIFGVGIFFMILLVEIFYYKIKDKDYEFMVQCWIKGVVVLFGVVIFMGMIVGV